jgi:SAM-dependent methyltransferase
MHCEDPIEMKGLKRVGDYWLGALRDSTSLIPGEELFFGHLLRIAMNSSRILEVGIGRGRMVNILKSNHVDAEFLGVDLTSNVRVSGVKGIFADARRLPLRDNYFDLTYSLGVIEHFPETRVAVSEHARVTKPGGYILITTPHLALLTPIRYLVYLIKDSRHGSFEETKGRNIRAKLMKKYFEDSGISVIRSGFYGIWELDYLLRNYRIGKLLLNLQKTSVVGSYMYVLGQKKAVSHTTSC